MTPRSLIAMVLLFLSPAVLADVPLLERKISVAFHGERLDASLTKIGKIAGFTFSYSPAIFEASKIINDSFVNKSVRQVLDEFFKGTIEYKTRGRHIILTKAEVTSLKKEPAILTGYVVDEATGEHLKNVSVYDPITLTSTLTDSYGYFEIKIDKPSADVILSVNKLDYTDTLVAVQPHGRLLNIPMRINKDKIAVIADSVSQKIKRFWKAQVLYFQNINVLNIEDTLYRTTQLSLVPFVGTNHKLSGNVINDYSFNIFGGYSLGVEKLEIGGLFNLVRGDMNGAQFGGTFNAVGGKMNGVQFAGIFNANRDTTRGAQFAGVFNVNWSHAEKFSAAGTLNINRQGAEGVQLAGVGNMTAGEQKGSQLAGVFNISTGNTGPLQLAGVYNLAARDMHGLQGAGVFNLTAGNVRGTQLAPVFNLAGRNVKGSQISALFNFARHVHGTQIGLINMADSMKGVPIGLMSFVWKGYHKIEVSADEIFYTNVAFRTGVREFYNIFTAGAKPSTFKDQETLWSFGYGVGTAPRVSRKIFLNLDVTSNQVVHGNSIETLQLLNKLYIGFDYQAFRKVSLTFGGTLNGYVTERGFDQDESLFTHYHPDIFYTRDIGSRHNLKMWIGGKVGLRFL
jgi:hypothetical protein